MSAFVKVYTDSGHTTEVAHTTQNATTLNGAVSAGATSITLTSTAGMPTQGYIDIIDGTNGNETLNYFGLSGNVIQIARTGGVQFAHATGLTVNQWYYSLAIGDQTNGIANDGSNNTPVAANTGTWYLYNAGDQTAQSLSVATASGAPSTTSGFADTNISQTSSSSGFAASQAIGNLAAAAVKQIWVDAQIPSGQSNANNPQICQLSMTYSSI